MAIPCKMKKSVSFAAWWILKYIWEKWGLLWPRLKIISTGLYTKRKQMKQWMTGNTWCIKNCLPMYAYIRSLEPTKQYALKELQLANTAGVWAKECKPYPPDSILFIKPS